MIARIPRRAAALLIALSFAAQSAVAQTDDAQARLTRAIRANDANEVAAALQDGADATKPVNEFCDAAYLALSYANADVLRRMIEVGVDFRKTKPPTRSPLSHILAKSAVSPEAVRVVMDAGWNEINGLDSNFLGSPAAVRSEKITRMLLEGGCAADGPVAELWKPIIYAAWRGTAPVVNALADADADVSAPGPRGRTPLHFAAIRTDRNAGEVVAALAAAGADLDAKDDQGFTPVFLAIYHRGTASLTALLKAGADPNFAPRRNMAPLAYAAVAGSVEQMRLLLEFGADPNVPTLKGATILETVLMNASFENADKVARKRNAAVEPRELLVELAASDPVGRVQALLEGGADANKIGSTGWTPLMLACALWVAERTPRADGRSHEDNRWAGAATDVAAFIERHNPADIVRLLAANGAKRTAPDSPLMEMDIAAMRGDLWSRELAELLGTIPTGTARVEPARRRNKDDDDLVEPTF